MPSLNTAFPWIGLPAAAVLSALLATDALRSDQRVSRWHDLGWLSWAGVAAYLIHNVEEYGFDLHGEAYAFPKAFCAMFGFSALYPQCPAPGAVFTAVNVPMFWFAAPLGARLSKRYPLAGLRIFSVITVNLVAHTFTSVLREAEVRISMDGRGRWMDNVFIERLWRSVKYECVYLHAFETGSELRH